MKQVPIYRRKRFKTSYYAIVDDEDYAFLIRFSWCISMTPQRPNRRVVYTTIENKTVVMARLLLGINNPKIEVDHKDNDGLNNQRLNLRIATRSQNAANRKLDKTNKSGYKGVSWDNNRKLWFAQITCKGVHQAIGYFTDKLSAARAYNEVAYSYFGEFAFINKLKPEDRSPSVSVCTEQSTGNG